jgi:type IV fimbrial biogenesis protein FimT
MTQKNPKTAVGVTLIELLVTMSVLVILLTVGASQLGYMVAHNARSTEVNALIGHLNFARAEAVSRAVDICVCPVDLAAETIACTGSDWSAGYAVVEQFPTEPLTFEALRLHKAAKSIRIKDSTVGDKYCFGDYGTVTSGIEDATTYEESFTFCDARDYASADGARDDGVAPPARLFITSMGRAVLSETDNIDCKW